MNKTTDSPESRRRVLVVSPYFPYPPHWGFARRVFHLCAELNKRSNVTLLAYAHDNDAALQLEMARYASDVITVPDFPRENRRKRFRQAASLCSPVPFHAGQFRPYGLQEALNKVVAATPFDLIQIEASQLGWLRTPEGIPVVLDEHNIESEVLARIAAAEQQSVRRGFNRYETWRYHPYEQRIWRRVQGVSTTSVRDAGAVVRASPETLTRVVPNGVDTSEFAPAAVDNIDVIVFTGLLGYRPNFDGVRWFVHEVLPLVRESRPEARLLVVGSASREVIEPLRAPGAEFLGWVPDVRPHLSTASVVVVPLLAGGGTRLKVLEALSCGRAVVSTSLGVEGIDVVDGEELLIRDSPADFASAVVTLLEDLALRRRLGDRARALALGRYSWNHSVIALEALHDDILGTSRSDTANSDEGLSA